MIFSFKLKKQVYRAKTKSEVISKGGNDYISSSEFGTTHIGTYTDGKGVRHVKVYTLQKYKKKTSQKKVRSKKGDFPMETKSTVLRPLHWEMNVYYIPIPLLVSLGKYVEQKDRTFVIRQR